MSPTEHEVASVDDLSTHGSKVIADVEGLEVAVFNLDGELYALANFCPHQSGPLCEGPLTGRVALGDDGWNLRYEAERYVECPWHSRKFDVRTGKNASDVEHTAVPTYDVKVEDDSVFVVR